MVEVVCTDELVLAADVLDTVAALVDKSLVVREPEVLGQARFRMLDTVREYAAEKLALAGEATETQHRFRDHTLAVAERNFAVGMALVPAPWQDRVDVFRRYDVDAGNVWLVLGRVPRRGRRRRPGCGSARRSGRACWCAASSPWAASGLTRSSPCRRRPTWTSGSGGRRSSGEPSWPCRVTRPAPSPRPGPALTCAVRQGDQFWTAAGLNLLSEIAVHTGAPR